LQTGFTARKSFLRFWFFSFLPGNANLNVPLAIAIWDYARKLVFTRHASRSVVSGFAPTTEMRFRFTGFPFFATTKGQGVFHQPARFQKEKSNSCKAPNHVKPGLTPRSTRTQPLRIGFINHRAASVAPVSSNR